MINYLYKSLRSEKLEKLEEYRRGTWVYVEAPTPEELEFLQQRFNLDEGILSDALDEDEQPRLEREGDQSYVFVRFAYKRSATEFDTAPLLLIFGGEYVITVSPRVLPMLARFNDGKLQFATTQRAKLLLQILTTITDQYDAHVAQTTRRIKAIRNRLRGQGITNEDFLDFVTIEDELNEFLSALQPNNAVLRRLLTSRHLGLHDEDQDIVEDLLLGNAQSIEASQANIKSISNIRDAYSSISANRLNQTLTFLTVVTLIVSLPSFAMGIYSMNMKLPFQQTSWIFWVVMAVNLVLMCTVFYVARKKHII